MTTIEDLDKQIRRLTGEHAESRPFICSGSPLGCAVAEIGINPGTPTPFWSHWSVRSGFDKRGWLADYLARHGKAGPTRRNIDLFAESLYPHRCLELNLYDRFSPRSADLPRELKRTEVFEYLIHALTPRLILVHGDEPAAHLAATFGRTLVKDRFVPVDFHGVHLEVYQAKSHVMKVSKEYVRSLASTFSQRLASAG